MWDCAGALPAALALASTSGVYMTDCTNMCTLATSTIPFSASICAFQLLKVNRIYRSSAGGIQHNSMTVSQTVKLDIGFILYISCLLNTTISVRTRVNHAPLTSKSSGCRLRTELNWTEIDVKLRPTVSRPVYLGVGLPSELMARFFFSHIDNCGFLDVGAHPLMRVDL
jgi:hypothetical protein